MSNDRPRDVFQNYFKRGSALGRRKQKALDSFDKKCHPLRIDDRYLFEVQIFKMNVNGSKYLTCPKCRDYKLNPGTQKMYSLLKPVRDTEAAHNYECIRCGGKFMIVSSTCNREFSLKDDGLISVVLPQEQKQE